MTRLTVRVKPGSKRAGLERAGDHLVLRVRERAVEGAANAGCIRELAEVLGVRQAQVVLLHGERARQKTFGIEGVDENDLRLRLERAEGTTARRANADER